MCRRASVSLSSLSRAHKRHSSPKPPTLASRACSRRSRSHSRPISLSLSLYCLSQLYPKSTHCCHRLTRPNALARVSFTVPLSPISSFNPSLIQISRLPTMPAAAKIEKPNATAVVVAAAAAVNSGEPITNGKGKANSNGASNQVQDPQKIVATIIEKKVRNLEKRKVCLSLPDKR